MDFGISRRILGSLVLLLVLLSCSKREELFLFTASNNINGIILHVEGEQGSLIELDQDFLKDFRASTYGKPIDPELRRPYGKEGIRLGVWPYIKKWLNLKDGDIFTSPLRLSKGRSHIDLTCHYLFRTTGIPEMVGGNDITLIKVSYQGKSYERRDGGLILPLVWSQGKLQVK